MAEAKAKATGRARKVLVTGSGRVNRKLAALPLKLQKKLVRQALRTIAKQALVHAKSWAPEDEGTLQRSLKVRAMKRSRVRFGSMIVTDPKTFQQAGENTVHAFWQEFGTKYAAAQPFLRPTLKQVAPFARQQFNKAMKDLVLEAGRG